MGKDAKDVSKEDALSYVAAYTVGNDVSSRKLQIDRTIAGPVPQWGFSKGFDTFAPLGPCLVRRDLIKDPSELRLQTKIDGELRQDTLVSDLVFDCAALVSYLSTGTTLQKGSIIMTGTPGGTSTFEFYTFKGSMLTITRRRERSQSSSVHQTRYSDEHQRVADWYFEERG
jgi:2-keto-4-pentenoate hydratase/2-oxohepta-3-ene-1,7-dioic acid hydratase in catechol pathway